MVSKSKLYLFWFRFWCLVPFLLRGLRWVKLCAWTQNHPSPFNSYLKIKFSKIIGLNPPPPLIHEKMVQFQKSGKHDTPLTRDWSTPIFLPESHSFWPQFLETILTGSGLYFVCSLFVLPGPVLGFLVTVVVVLVLVISQLGQSRQRL